MALFSFFKNNYSIKAFTLLEVLASLAIVTMVLLGPVVAAVNSSSYASQSRDVMTSKYLAEEALELLHHQYDTLYIQCINRVDACADAVAPTLGNESQPEKAWRLFKDRIDTPGNITSCYSSKGSGCSYDFITMLDDSNPTPPDVYSPSGSECSNISILTSTVGSGGEVRHYYVCKGITNTNPSRLKDTFISSNITTYTRKITAQSVPNFESASPYYQDDLIVTASVTYRRTNGIVRTIKVVDFLHSRS